MTGERNMASRRKRGIVRQTWRASG